jgi:surface antigen
MKSGQSLRTEMKLTVVVLAVIFSLPILFFFAIAHTSLSILSLGVADILYQGPVSKTDLYAYGNCTYWAALLREQVGMAVPNTWGNANTWATRAKLDGYLVDNSPKPDAIMQTSAGALGHVAFVVSVNSQNGSWTISEMNVKGFDIIDTQTLSASAAKYYNFIHDKIRNQSIKIKQSNTSI